MATPDVAAVVVVVEDRPRPGLLRRQRPDGAAPSVAFCVADKDLRHGTSTLDAVQELADNLHGAGWRTIVHRDSEAAVVADGTDLVVVASRFTDIRRLPGAAKLVALVLTDPGAWTARDCAGDFDAWLTTTSHMTERLRWHGREAVLVDPASSAARDVLESVRESVPARPMWLGFYPDWRAGNPYLEMLYSRAQWHDVVAVPVENPALLAPTAFAGDRAVTRVLHIHWSDAIAQSAANEDEAWSRAASFADGVAAFQASGGILVWTVHNVLPHDLRFPGPESAVLTTLSQRADVVHVMGATTTEAVRPHYSLDASRILDVPHPSYIGWYPDSVGRAHARLQLGLEPEVPVVLLQGQIREYKGVDRLLAALDDPRVEAAGVMALVAGAPGQTPGVARLMRACEEHPRVISRFERVPHEEMQLLYKAADAAVLPYTRTLNSGALMAALGFATPVIAPRTGSLPQMIDDRCALLFDPSDESGLADALAGIDRLRTPQARAAARSRAEAVLPAEVSDAFLAGLRQRIGRLQAPRSS
ncbi:MAG: glycosyltransferase [Candidatus Nanopelagicales bacterium]